MNNNQEKEKQINEEIIDIEQNDTAETIYQLDIRRQEIDAIIEKYEDSIMKEEEPNISIEEIDELKKEYKDITKKQKELNKNRKKTIWDQMPLWMAIYAVFMLVLSFFFEPLYHLSYKFLSLVYPLFVNIMEVSLAFEYVLLAIIPFLAILTSFIIFLSLKNKVYKKLFGYIFLIHGIETLAAVIILIVLTVQNS